MSKTKTSKFNDSGNMLPVFIASVVVGVDLIMKASFDAQLSCNFPVTISF